MFTMFCRVQLCTDFTRVHVENQAFSGGTVECNRVQIGHVGTSKINVVQRDAMSTFAFTFTRVIRVSACMRCQQVVVELQQGLLKSNNDNQRGQSARDKGRFSKEKWMGPKGACGNAKKQITGKGAPICLYPECAKKDRHDFLKDCDRFTDYAERKKLFEDYRAVKNRYGVRKLGNQDTAAVEQNNLFIQATCAGSVQRIICTDSGSEINLLPPDVAATLLASSIDMRVTTFQAPRKYGMATKNLAQAEPVYVKCDRMMTMRTELHIRHGTTPTLRNLSWCVATQPMQKPLLIRPILQA